MGKIIEMMIKGDDVDGFLALPASTSDGLRAQGKPTQGAQPQRAFAATTAKVIFYFQIKRFSDNPTDKGLIWEIGFRLELEDGTVLNGKEWPFIWRQVVGSRVGEYENRNNEDGQNYLFTVVTMDLNVRGGEDNSKGSGIAGDSYVLDRRSTGIQIQIGDSITRHNVEFKVIKFVGVDAVSGDLPFSSNETITFRRLRF